MSTVAAPTATVSPKPSSNSRGVPIAIGATLATVGAVFALGGGGVLAVAGSDGTLDSGRHSLSTSTTALVTGSATINDTHGVSKVIGQPRIKLSVDALKGGPAAFVGVGPTAAVDRYLAQSPVERVSDFDVDPFQLTTHRVGGTVKPRPPATQSFWVAKGSGRTASLDWKVRDGSYRVVVMNADGTRGVNTNGNVEVKLPHLSAYAVAALILGLVTLGGGIALTVYGANGSGRPRAGGPASIS